MTQSIIDERGEWAEHTAPFWISHHSYPIYSWFTVSTYSPVPDDMWCRGWKAPFQIVLLPGYERPPGLETRDRHSIWYNKPVDEPTVVWDGHSATSLFETISECFDPQHQMTDFIKVRSVKTGEYVEDPRSPERMAVRPSRTYDGDILSAEREDEIILRREILYDFYCDIDGRPREIYSEFADLYESKYPEQTTGFLPKKIRMKVAREHPDIGAEISIYDRDHSRVALDGLKFGLARYENELAKKPKWYRAHLRIEREIAKGKLTNEMAILGRKVSNGVPLTDREAKIYNADQKRLSKMSAMDRLGDLVNRKR